MKTMEEEIVFNRWKDLDGYQWLLPVETELFPKVINFYKTHLYLWHVPAVIFFELEVDGGFIFFLIILQSLQGSSLHFVALDPEGEVVETDQRLGNNPQPLLTLETTFL